MDMFRCDCCFDSSDGLNLYHCEQYGTHVVLPNDYNKEYYLFNRFSEVKPEIQFFGHIDLRYAVMIFNVDKPNEFEENFKYSVYGDKREAYKAIIKRINELTIQSELF